MKMSNIYFNKSGNRWRACISINNKTFKLCSFKTKDDAIQDAVIKHRIGKF